MNWSKGGPSGKRGFGFGGFSLGGGGGGGGGKKEELRVPQKSHTSFGGAGTAGGYGKNQQLPAFYKIGTKRANFDEENAYFEDDEEESSITDLPYIPAENSPTRQQFQSGGGSDSEDDPLDAFMAQVEDQAAKDMKKLEEKEKEKKVEKGIRDDIEEEDEQEAYFRYMAENPTAGLTAEDEDENIDYDSDGNPIAPTTKKIIMPLPPMDHSEIDYPPFERNFYNEHEELLSLTGTEVFELRHKLNLRVSGAAPPKLSTSFAHFGFDEQLMHIIRKSEYTQPTPIQCQGVPIALSGRDMIGIAKTGSGKTAAFIWPMLVHIMDQKELETGEGPIAVIVCPTRELCQQIHAECKRFGKAYSLRSVAVYGGGSMWEQAKALQEGAEIVVCTPGRLIDHVKKKATSLQRVTYLVFDEADRMFDMGFEYQVRSIASHVRPDRQTLLFSATFRKKIERLARDILVDPIRVVQGDIGEANEDVTQIVEIMPSGVEKWGWLTRRLVEFTSSGSVLIFVTKKANCEELATNLTQEGHSLGLLHGDMDQSERNKVIADFKKKSLPVLVATDVAARGLDIPSIRTVVNYDVARDIDTHTHRIGRTGRAGEKGVAYTLLTSKDTSFAGDLVRNLEGANQSVSKELMDLAMQNPWFRKSRFKGGKGKKLNIGGGGLGYRERPGLGAESSERSGGAAMGNYEGYSKPTGAMGDRMSAMKSAFQSQYKNHFVAASGMVPKLTTKSSSSSGWTSAGSLSSVPTGAPEGPDRPRGPPSLAMAPPAALGMGTKMAGFTSAGSLSSVSDSQATAPQGYATPPSPREGPRDRHGDDRSRHGDGHYRDRRDRSERHSGGGERDRYGERDRHADRDRYGDKDRHGSSGRHGDSRNGDGSRRDRERDDCRGDRESGDRAGSEGRGDRAEGRGDREEDGFAVPDPPKRKKSRWDN
ncbi:ATP-dependent RNA helicase DDX42 [Salmo salar]|uniref:ATP-dependent RNA helicase DDX42 n=1 Tax=Salmo salar TaxID=8030 RepID=A0A1S3RAM4_SALSA|nr:ATP-dependent RNA helicase DDX42 [Salmo salar]XP_014049416.1 ATP-dependent RNA helicase DDX42 [Salmo salar]|eukprot:XP_014049415.1 PREDICTED: ATP-dependent RNA helicase DDX42-like [Salmo salar]